MGYPPRPSVFVYVLASDELEHRLVAEAALGAFFAQLVDQVLLKHDRGRQGLADRRRPPAARMSSPRSRFSNSSTWGPRLPAFLRPASDLRLRLGLEAPFVCP